MTKLHVEGDDGRCVPRRLEACGEGIAERSALIEKFGRRIDEIGDVGRVVVSDHQNELCRVGQTQFGGYVHERVGDDAFPFERAALARAVGPALSVFDRPIPSSSAE